MQYYIYMIRCEDNSLYTGITTDLKRRFKEHTSQKGAGAKYTHVRKPIKIEAAWETENGKGAALKLEAYLKKLKKCDKEKLVLTPHNLSEYLDERFEEFVFTVVNMHTTDAEV